MPRARLQANGVFVTLEVAGVLNGCVGAIETVEPLTVAVPVLSTVEQAVSLLA